MGGGTGTGAAHVIARAAKELNILTVGVVTLPFLYEGPSRMRRAQQGLDELRNTLILLLLFQIKIYLKLQMSKLHSKSLLIFQIMF